MTRVVIYARYSSDLQSESSIGDQLEVCRRYAKQQGWKVTEIYADRALSGASKFRPELTRMMADAENGRFDIMLAEALDRIGRKLADVAELFDRLNFHKIELHSVATGRITPLHVGLLGTMAQMYLSDLREKVRRGQLGRALAGRSPGGKAFGYRVLAGNEAGLREIDRAEAEVVRRIFKAFAGGESPRAIAKQLNSEGVPGPDGRAWRDTTIRGQVERGTGILNNALYVGRLEWNRCSYIKDPRTGKRVARPNPRKVWEVVALPNLRIVDDGLWERVRQRQAAVTREMGRDNSGNALNRAHRRRFLLSGLLVCGVCGSGFTIIGKDSYGCANRRSVGTCTNGHKIRRQEIEERVLDGLRDRLMAPALVEKFVQEFNAAIRDASRDTTHRRAREESRLAQIERKIAAIVRAVEDGLYNPAVKERLDALEAEKASVAAELAAMPVPTPIRLHPNLPQLYRQKVEALTETLNAPAIRTQAAEVLRSLIDRVELKPGIDGRLSIQLHGDLARILAMCETQASKRQSPDRGLPGDQLSVVAGRGFEPLTFRL